MTNTHSDPDLMTIDPKSLDPATFDPTTAPLEDLQAAVKQRYAGSARQVTGRLDDAASAGAGPAEVLAAATPDVVSRDLYPAEAASTSAGALAASLGCGNPTMLAELRPGQTVLDLGSGGGLDVLLSARRVGPTGKAYGLDMTTEMLELARRNQREAGVTNAEFLAGTIEQIPLPDESVDVVISNCVINLSGDKDAVFAEVFRVLRPGGRFAVADIVVLRPLPEPARMALTLWTGCVAGALLDADYLDRLGRAGLEGAEIQLTRVFGRTDLEDMATSLRPEDIPAGFDVPATITALDGGLASAFVRASKPAR